jgi:3-oxoacyl-[acyl-carrier protein] reductase
MNLKQSRVLITGGGSGLGLAMVRGFLRDGATLGVLEKNDRAREMLERDFRGQVKVWQCDVSDVTQVERAMAAISDEEFSPNVLINNAGIIHSEPLINTLKKEGRRHSVENWRGVLSANLDSVFYVTSSVVDQMLQKRVKGVVISISSISASGNPGQTAYSASKAGVNALTRTWAKELGGFGIRFAAIAPGFFETESSAAALGEKGLAAIKSRVPLRSLGSADDIYLAARSIVENQYVNGAVFSIDGGLTL